MTRMETLLHDEFGGKDYWMVSIIAHISSFHNIIYAVCLRLSHLFFKVYLCVSIGISTCVAEVMYTTFSFRFTRHGVAWCTLNS